MKGVSIMATVVYFNEEGKRTWKERIKFQFSKGKEWVVRNKEQLIVITPIAVSGITTIIKVVAKHNNWRKQEELHDLYCYDRSLGHYWRLRRELSNKEWLEIDRRKKKRRTSC